MAVAYFRVQLTVRPKQGGDAELVLPNALKDLDPHFVVVKEGGQEGIVQVEAPETVLKKIAKDDRCTRFALEEIEALRAGYPPPKIKLRYRPIPVPQIGVGADARPELFALDAGGDRMVDTYQTVRSGFYLIDVPIMAASEK